MYALRACRGCNIGVARTVHNRACEDDSAALRRRYDHTGNARVMNHGARPQSAKPNVAPGCPCLPPPVLHFADDVRGRSDLGYPGLRCGREAFTISGAVDTDESRGADSAETGEAFDYEGPGALPCGAYSCGGSRRAAAHDDDVVARDHGQRALPGRDACSRLAGAAQACQEFV